jgi:hypothetical protein
MTRRAPSLAAPMAIGGLLVGCVVTWQIWPEEVHPLFGRATRCRERGLRCRDQPGSTMGAAPTPIVHFLRQQLESGDGTFRGRAEFAAPGPAYIAAWLAEDPPREHWDEVTIMVEERNRNFLATGNGMLLRALPFQGIPVASSYEQALDYLYYLVWTRYVNEGVGARHSFNFTSLLTVWPERLALVGVRYVVVRDEPRPPAPSLRRVFEWRGYSTYEIPGANTAGYAPTRVQVGSTLSEELRMMRAGGFDPSAQAVLGIAEAAAAGLRGPLVRLADSGVRLDGQTLAFEGRSAGQTLAVLPFKFSHCWRAEWDGPEGHVLRANVALLGVLFENATRVRLTWAAGYGPQAECLKADRRLVPQAISAAQDLR